MKGTYQAQVVSTALAAVGEKKTPSVKVKFETEFAIHDIETPAIQTVYADLWLTEKCWERSMDNLSILGWNGTDLNDLNGTDLLVGQKAWLVLDEEEYNGETRTKVKFINAIGGGGIKAMEADEAKALAASLKGKMLKYRQNKPAPKAEGPAPAQSNDDDGLPFD